MSAPALASKAKLYPILRLLRPHQNVKNGFVLIGLMFADHWTQPLLIQAVIVFLAFCAMSSAVYAFNDILDRDEDRKHPLKKNRPIASGEVSVRLASYLAAFLFVLALVVSGAIGILALLPVLAYALLNVGYSLYWKRIAVVDVFIISAGFMLRILAGTVGIGIAPSSWLLLCGLMLTLFLGFAKRHTELTEVENLHVDGKPCTRRVLDEYNIAMIRQFMAVSAACVIISYSIYTVAPETVARHHTQGLIATVPFVVYGVFRYLYLLHRGGHGTDTAWDVVNDVHMRITVLGWFVTAVAVLASGRQGGF